MTVWIDPSPHNQAVIAHEMTHVKFFNALDDTRGEARHAAVNEGLADVSAFLLSDGGTRFIGGQNLRNPSHRTSAT
jgi:uncharacterized protein YjaZ